MPRLVVNNYMAAGRNAGFESVPTFVAATTTGDRWIDGAAAGSQALVSAWGWAIISGSTAGSYAAKFDNSTAHTGTYSMKVSTTAVSSNIQVGNSRGTTVPQCIRSLLKIAPSTTYNYSFWMKTNYVSGDSAAGAFLTFSQRTVSGSSTAETASSAGNIKTTTDWTNYTGSFTTDSDAHWLLFKLGVTGNSGTGTLIMDAWFDDIEIYPATAVTRTATS